MNKKLLKIITGIAVAGAALGAAFAYVKKCKEVNDLGEEDFDDLWDDEEEKIQKSTAAHHAAATPPFLPILRFRRMRKKKKVKRLKPKKKPKLAKAKKPILKKQPKNNC